ncbi:MAG TPA: hypothetical protein DEB39_15775 [Planctomycetaceae bacterium]|nr:hypothetical protein [Planctomycetaceae bacterium]
MNDFNNLFNPGDTIGDAPLTRYFATALSAVAMVAVLGVIGFVLVETTLDYLGYPLRREPAFPQLDPTQDDAWKFPQPRPAEEIAAEFTILCPRDHMVLEHGKPVVVICTWSPFFDPQRTSPPEEPPIYPFLEIDDRPVLWNALYGKNLWFAAVDLTPGKHEIRTAGKQCVFFVRGESPAHTAVPGNGFLARFHPGLDHQESCCDCHRLKERTDIHTQKREFLAQQNEITALHDKNACLQCHPEAEFEKKHGHSAETFADCVSCHTIHGSTVPGPGLLKQPKEQLCILCHKDEGYTSDGTILLPRTIACRPSVPTSSIPAVSMRRICQRFYARTRPDAAETLWVYRP